MFFRTEDGFVRKDAVDAISVRPEGSHWEIVLHTPSGTFVLGTEETLEMAKAKAEWNARCLPARKGGF